MLAALRLFVASWICASPLAAQGHAHADSAQAAAGAARAMAGGAHGKHLEWTPLAKSNARDSARALAIADTLRRAIAQFADTSAAVRAGYKMFAPHVAQQAVYHFTSNAAGLLAAFRFDPSRATSLLYKKDSRGTLKLVGAMYTAPARYSTAQLNARVPLSAGQWHRHVNLCIPHDERELDRMRRGDSTSRFGLAGDIADKATCDKAGGRFAPRVYGWMLHVNVFEGTAIHDVFETAASHAAPKPGEGHKH